MIEKTKKPAPPCKAATGSDWDSLAASDRDNSKALPEVQSAFLVARFGLDGTRARLTAELVWGRR